MNSDMMDRTPRRSLEPVEVFVADNEAGLNIEELLTGSLNRHREFPGEKANEPLWTFKGNQGSTLWVCAGGQGDRLHVAIGLFAHLKILKSCLESRGSSIEALDWKGGAFFKPDWTSGEVVITDRSMALGPIPPEEFMHVKAALEKYIQKHFLQG